MRLTGRTELAGCGDVEEELTVAFGSWKPRFDGCLETPAPLWHLGRHLVEYAAEHLGVADDAALAHVRPAGLELRLYEHQRAPSLCGAVERRWKGLAEGDE